MNLIVTEFDGDLLVRVGEDRIDAAAAVQFRDAMRTLSARGHRRLVLDLSQVTFVDSSGLGAIVGAMKHLGADRDLELAALAPPVARVFRLTRLDEVFRIHAKPVVAEPGPTHAG